MISEHAHLILPVLECLYPTSVCMCITNLYVYTFEEPDMIYLCALKSLMHVV